MSGSRRCSIIVLTALCAGMSLSGCTSGSLELDPAYWFPDGKKKLPGDRREVFPEGVPGVTQGIPPELVRGNPANQALQDPNQAGAPVEAAPPPPPPQAAKPKPRPKRVARPAPAPAPDPQEQPAPRPQAQQPAPRPAASGAWPTPQAQQQQPAPQAAPSSGWPAPPAAGTFTR